MKKEKVFGTIISILFTAIIFSCSNKHKNEVKFEHEDSFMTICESYHIPTDTSIIVFLPPTRCRTCQLNALAVLDSLPNAYILHDEKDDCDKKISSQNCIAYESSIMEKRGLVKLYSALIKVKDRKVVFYKELFK